MSFATYAVRDLYVSHWTYTTLFIVDHVQISSIGENPSRIIHNINMHEERSCIYGKLIYCINHLIIFLSQNLSEAVDVALAIQDSAKKDRKVR